MMARRVHSGNNLLEMCARLLGIVPLSHNQHDPNGTISCRHTHEWNTSNQAPVSTKILQRFGDASANTVLVQKNCPLCTFKPNGGF